MPAGRENREALRRLAGDARSLEALTVLEQSTDERRRGEAGELAGISVRELVFGVPHAEVVNAAFCHPAPGGGRFNGAERGAWYAGFAFKTAAAEVVHHKREELREIGWREPETFTFVDWLADFRADFHDVRGGAGFEDCLAADDYHASQALARRLLEAGAMGIVYPSVRHPGGTCVACFRPALVSNVRVGGTAVISFESHDAAPRIIRRRG